MVTTISDTNSHSTKTKGMNVDELRTYGADSRLINTLSGVGFHEFREIQTEAIKQGLFKNVSLFVCAPSGSGKTLIGEMAAINNILQKSQKSLYLVPLRALAGEKFSYFKEMYGYLGIQIVMAVGDMDIKSSDLGVSDLLIMTYEKFDSYLRALPENQWIKQIQTIIIDEIHIIGEPKRGPRLEALLLRLFIHLQNIQVISLSATVANPKEIGDWFKKLNASFSKNEFKIIYSDHRPIELDYSIVTTANKMHTIEELSKPILMDNGQVLIFTNSRRETEQVSEGLMDFVSSIMTKEDKFSIKKKLRSSEIAPLVSNANFNENLYELINQGVAYHHAGLDASERFVIEKLFVQGVIKVIVCTTTLSAGINTPARMVILKETDIYEQEKEDDFDFDSENKPTSRKFMKKSMDRNTFHQILGRAGRPGYDSVGIASILVYSENEALKIQDTYFSFDKTKPKNKFTPKYDEILSYLHNRTNLLEFLLLCIYEQDKIRLTDLYQLLQYSYFTGIAESREAFKPILFDILDAELLPLLKAYSKTADLIDVERSDLDVAIKKFTTDGIDGLVSEPDFRVTFNVKFNCNQGVYCECTRKYWKKTSILQADPRPFYFCKHQIAFIRHLMTVITENEFELMYAKENNDMDDQVKSGENNRDPDDLHIIRQSSTFQSADDIYTEKLMTGKLNKDKIVTITITSDEIIHKLNLSKGPITRLNAKNLIDKIMNRAIRSDNVIDFLIQNQLISIIYEDESDQDVKKEYFDKDDRNKKNKKKNVVKPNTFKIDMDTENLEIEFDDISKDISQTTIFKCSELGKSIIKGYIYPHTALNFRVMLINYIKQKSKIAVENKLIISRIDYINDLLNMSIQLLKMEDRNVPQYPNDILLMHIDENPSELIHTNLIAQSQKDGKNPRLYQIDIKNFIDYSARVFHFMMEFTKALLSNEFINNNIHRPESEMLNALHENCETLYYRVRFGIREELVFLASKFKDLSTEEIRILYQNGVTNEGLISKLTPKNLSNILKIPEKRSEQLLRRI